MHWMIQSSDILQFDSESRAEILYIWGKTKIFFLVFLRYIQSTCATTGEGLYEGMEWLSRNIADKVEYYQIAQR